MEWDLREVDVWILGWDWILCVFFFINLLLDFLCDDWRCGYDRIMNWGVCGRIGVVVRWNEDIVWIIVWD